MHSRGAQAPQRGRGDGDRLGHRGAAGLRARLRRRGQCPGRRLLAERGGDHRHQGRGAEAFARRAAGRHGPRVQPHPERRHGAQPAAGRHPRGPHLVRGCRRAPDLRDRAPTAGAGARGARRGRGYGGLRGAHRVHRLSRNLRRRCHQGRHFPRARAARRLGERPVHPQPRRHRRRARLDPRPARPHGGARGAVRAVLAHVLRPGLQPLVEPAGAPADPRAHPPRPSALQARRVPGAAPWHAHRGRRDRRFGQRGEEPAHARRHRV